MSKERLGYRIVASIERPPKTAFQQLMKVTTGNVCDAMDRSGAMDYRIKPVVRGMKCVGTAITVKARPRDNLMVYKALDLAREGDVIVIALGGYAGASTWGDLTSLIGFSATLRMFAAISSRGPIVSMCCMTESRTVRSPFRFILS